MIAQSTTLRVEARQVCGTGSRGAWVEIQNVCIIPFNIDSRWQCLMSKAMGD